MVDGAFSLSKFPIDEIGYIDRTKISLEKMRLLKNLFDV